MTLITSASKEPSSALMNKDFNLDLLQTGGLGSAENLQVEADELEVQKGWAGLHV